MNILFTSLSLPKSVLSYSYAEENGKKLYTYNYESEEPGAKYILHSNGIDKIVVVGTKETHFEKDPVEISDIVSYYKEHSLDILPDAVEATDHSGWHYNLNGVSSFEMFVRRIGAYLIGDEQMEESDKNYIRCPGETMRPLSKNCTGHSISVVFVPDVDPVTGKINYAGLLKELRGTEKERTHIYMDVQGSGRSITFVRNTVLQLVSRQDDTYRTSLERVIATNYNPQKKDPRSDDFENRIVDETATYRVSDLFSGFCSFLNFGKVNDIDKYFKDNKALVTEPIRCLVRVMRKIDEALSFNDIGALLQAIDELKPALEDEALTAENSVFSILVDGIKTDYAPFLSEKLNIRKVLEWCSAKNQYLTAATLVESRLPGYFYDEGIVTIAPEESEKAGKYFSYYRECIEDRKQRYKFEDSKHFFIKYYLPYYQNVKHGYERNGHDFCGFADRIYSAAFLIRIQEDRNDELSYVMALYALVSELRNECNHAAEISDITINRITERVNQIKRAGSHLGGKVAAMAAETDFHRNTARINLLKKAIQDILTFSERLETADSPQESVPISVPAFSPEIFKELVRTEIPLVEQECRLGQSRYLEGLSGRDKNNYKSFILTPLMKWIHKLLTEGEALQNDEALLNEFVSDNELVRLYREYCQEALSNEGQKTENNGNPELIKSMLREETGWKSMIEWHLENRPEKLMGVCSNV